MCDIVRHTHISFIQHLLKSLYGEVRAWEIKAAMYPCPCDYYGGRDGTPGLLPWICRVGLGSAAFNPSSSFLSNVSRKEKLLARSRPGAFLVSEANAH
jgi:hypothetical protein